MQSTKCPVSDFFGFRSLTVEICSARVMSRLSRQSPDFYKKGTVQCHLHFSSGESSTDRLVIMTIIMMMENKIMIVLFSFAYYINILLLATVLWRLLQARIRVAFKLLQATRIKVA